MRAVVDDKAPFWPDSWDTIAYMAVIALTVAALAGRGGRDRWWVAGALAVSWVGARFATDTGASAVYIASLTLAAWLSFTPSSRVICMLYAFRLLLVPGALLGAYGWSTMWLANEAFLIAQILLAWMMLIGSRNNKPPGNSRSDRRYRNNGGLFKIQTGH